MSGATWAVAEWAAQVRPRDLSEELRHQARRILVDYTAAAVVGSTTALSRRVRAHLAEAAPGEQATVVGGTRLAAGGAAFANGTAAHGLELDDGYTPGSVHPGAVTLPAVLAAAELAGADPDELVAAVAVGVEVTARIAAAGHPATLRGGFHNTAVAGVFGAAAGAARLLGADSRQLVDALGIAGSHAGGLREYHTSASDTKRLHAGKTARDGLGSAQLALAGVTGPETVLEGRQGYFASIARGSWDESTLLDGLGSTWVCLRTYVKPYPCCRHLHGPVDAVLALQERQGIPPADVVAVSVETFGIASRHGRRHCTSLLEAQLSIPFAVATTLRSGVPGLASFGPEARADPEVARLAALVSVACDAELDSAYPRARPARVAVTLRNGAVLRREIRYPLGEPSNPIDDEGLGAKFLRLTTPVVGEQHAADLLAALWKLDDLEPLTTGLGAAAWPTRRPERKTT
ncbi:MmgE/PrpD family protein [Saccharomonospora sp. NPDC046836]|uniref:MmgE/PrpD family protein n=1 Tax=Saccharomonospora sp. NPDC046836 TaxID=3156921 RepID=UPI0033DBD619